jgi:hypothetical protein
MDIFLFQCPQKTRLSIRIRREPTLSSEFDPDV